MEFANGALRRMNTCTSSLRRVRSLGPGYPNDRRHRVTEEPLYSTAVFIAEIAGNRFIANNLLNETKMSSHMRRLLWV